MLQHTWVCYRLWDKGHWRAKSANFLRSGGNRECGRGHSKIYDHRNIPQRQLRFWNADRNPLLYGPRRRCAGLDLLLPIRDHLPNDHEFYNWRYRNGKMVFAPSAFKLTP